ncbi:Kcnh6, partial [Symbiodinium natans]
MVGSEEHILLTVLEWMTQLFWTADLITSSLTGFYEKGALILDLKRSAYHYMKTWGPFDLALVSVGWLFIFLDPGGDEAQGDLLAWSRTLRALRFLRFVRVLRWLKLRGVAEAFQEMFHSNAAFFYYSLVSAGMRLVILNHLLACCWFGVALVGDPNQNWVREAGLWEAEEMDKYLASLNWSFAMLGVGLSNIKTTTSLEVAFSVVVAFRSLMTYATLISSITTLTSALNKIREDENTEFRLLRSYLSHNDIGQELSQKITRFLQHQYHLRQQARSAHLNVPLLNLLSSSLKGELDFARRKSSMLKLSFLDQLLPTDDLQVMQTMHNLASTAMEDVAAASGDVIFLGGSKATAAYLKLNGSLNYFYTDENDEEKAQE